MQAHAGYMQVHRPSGMAKLCSQARPQRERKAPAVLEPEIARLFNK